jgi:hypothetical protein
MVWAAPVIVMPARYSENRMRLMGQYLIVVIRFVFSRADVVSADETHTIYNSETLKKITKFRIGEWHNGISDLYEVKPMTQSESDKVWNSLSL